MNNWSTFPKRGWALVGGILSGFGKGEGSYETAYAVSTDSGPFLNGRVSASVRLAGDRPINSAGVIARADNLRNFAAFYVVTDNTAPNSYSVRLAAFKYGKLETMVGLSQPVLIPNNQFHIALQFFSGDMIGQVITGGETHTLRYVLSEPPFPGYGGVVRFYNSSVTASNIQIEEITMKPILPEEDDKTSRKQPISVFLSYASADKEIVLKVTKALKESAIPYWVDHERITFGDRIVSKIEEGLRESKYVVVCLSKNLPKSGWCRAEYGPILYREFSGDTSKRVIPLSLDGSKDNDAVPLLLSDKMRADFTDRNSFSAFIRFLRGAGSG